MYPHVVCSPLEMCTPRALVVKKRTSVLKFSSHCFGADRGQWILVKNLLVPKAQRVIPMKEAKAKQRVNSWALESEQFQPPHLRPMELRQVT